MDAIGRWFFFLLFWGYIVGYPVLQLLTLWRSGRIGRMASGSSMILTGPFYALMLFVWLKPQTSKLEGLALVPVFFVGPPILMYLLTIAVLAERSRRSTRAGNSVASESLDGDE